MTALQADLMASIRNSPTKYTYEVMGIRLCLHDLYYLSMYLMKILSSNYFLHVYKKEIQ